jgi:tRNA A-37 threonylcarbamoyl transferase component Bud32
MIQEFTSPDDNPEDRGLPSADEVVERLERLWSPSAPLAGWTNDFRGLRLGRYDLRGLRGQGAFGVVYLAHDTQLNRDVAIKIPRAQVLADVEKRHRFEAEASTAAMLDHSGIVTVYEADLVGPTPYIASAFCSGPDLGQWLEGEHAVVSWSDAAAFVSQLADAVEYAHQKGVYHRDLKPSNVLLSPVGQANGNDGEGDGGDRLSNYQPKITDFGLAKLAQVTAAETRSSLLLGTPLYMAPEQLESNRGAPPAAADVYSLGCLLYELVAGRPPLEGETYVEMLDRLREVKPAPLRKLRSEAPRELETVCAKCLEKDPAARYETAGQLAADLRACVTGGPIEARDPSLISRFKYWCTRPQRIRDAGWYTLCVELLLVAWTGITMVGAQGFDTYSAAEKSQLAIEFVLLILAVNLPMMVAGWYTTRHRGWAIYAGLILTVINLFLPLAFVVVTDRLFFAAIYARVDSSNFYAFSSGVLVFLAEFGQLVLYAAAIAAWQKLTKHRSHDPTPSKN